MQIEVSFSVEDEVSRIKNTVKKYKWYIENGYKPDLPLDIKNRLEKSENITNDDIKIAVEKEYQPEVYQKKTDEINEAWKIEPESFLEKLKSLSRPLPEMYYICLTRYGVGGSYGFPEDIQLNINKSFESGILHTIFHEIVHLTIEDLIQLHNIPHWTKERLVNLTMNKFFPEEAHLQRDPENAEKVSEIFEKNFPNIEKVILEISRTH